jgi:succinate dehydrogenase / fumarate reductase, cytochrome b subunit
MSIKLFRDMAYLPASRIEEKMYKGQAGMWSWLFHRVSGLAILLFLLIHIVDISMLSFGPTVYNNSILLFDQWEVRLLSLSLIAAILYHAFNGIRIMLIDFWAKAVKYQKVLFAIVLVVTIALFIPAAYFVMGPVLSWFIHVPVASVSH